MYICTTHVPPGQVLCTVCEEIFTIVRPLSRVCEDRGQVKVNGGLMASPIVFMGSNIYNYLWAEQWDRCVPLDFFCQPVHRASSPPGTHVRGESSQQSLACRYTCPKSKNIKQWLEHEPHSGRYYTFLRCTTLQYNPNVQARQGNPLTSDQTDRTSVPFGQSRDCYKKTSQGNKIWLEWFPCFALLNSPFQYYRELTS